MLSLIIYLTGPYPVPLMGNNYTDLFLKCYHSSIQTSHHLFCLALFFVIHGLCSMFLVLYTLGIIQCSVNVSGFAHTISESDLYQACDVLGVALQMPGYAD